MTPVEEIMPSSASSFARDKMIEGFYLQLNKLNTDISQSTVAQQIPESVPSMLNTLRVVDQSENFMPNVSNVFSKLNKLGHDCPQLIKSLTENGSLVGPGAGTELGSVIESRQNKVFGKINSRVADLLSEIGKKMKQAKFSGLPESSVTLDDEILQDFAIAIEKMIDDGGIEDLGELSIIMKMLRHLGSKASPALLAKIEEALSDFIEAGTEQQGNFIDKISFINTVVDLIDSAPIPLSSNVDEIKNEIQTALNMTKDSGMDLSSDMRVEDIKEVAEDQELQDEAKKQEEEIESSKPIDEEQKYALNIEAKASSKNTGPIPEDAQKKEKVESVKEVEKKAESASLNQEQYKNRTLVKIMRQTVRIVEKVREPIMLKILDELQEIYTGYISQSMSVLEGALEEQFGEKISGIEGSQS